MERKFHFQEEKLLFFWKFLSKLFLLSNTFQMYQIRENKQFYK